jgi:putative transcriptional regulator
MLSSPQAVSLKRLPLLKQPGVSKLIRELRALTELTQEQFAAVLGVTYGTINRWENGHMQPSTLALKQIRAVLEQVIQSSAHPRQIRGQQLLRQYFAENE